MLLILFVQHVAIKTKAKRPIVSNAMDLPAFTYSVESRPETGSGSHNFVVSGEIAVQTNTIEVSVPRQALNPPAKSYIHGWNDKDGPPIDDTRVTIALF